jgi:hypothetical protein
MRSQERPIRLLALLLFIFVGGLGLTTTHADAPAGDAVPAVSSFDASKNEYLAHAQTVTVFDAPGAGTGQLQGTVGLGITPEGAIAGAYVDANNVVHGFIRAPSGAFTTFDAPGAGTGPGAPVCIETESCPGTIPWGINPAGEIAGQYIDEHNVAHGFVRFTNGTITTFDVPAAGTGPGQGSYGEGISPAGEILCTYSDASSVWHGCIRFRDGAIIVFDAPGAGIGPGQGTLVATFSGINPAGEITGYYFDGSDVVHGYVRTPDGAITTFDAPDTGALEGTYAVSINPKGQVTGAYADASGVDHGYLRAPDGTITTFGAPGAGTGSSEGTLPANINPGGEIAGNYVDSSGVSHARSIAAGHWHRDRDE